MRKLADYFLAMVAVAIMIGFPVWHWIHTPPEPGKIGFFANGSVVARSQ
jgi:hypothetical protein